jgi:predicted metal-binding transcription factor (methanogenesis marker protein 9)
MSKKTDLTSPQPVTLAAPARAQPATSTGTLRVVPVSVAFIHNFLDEYGLDPYEFRLYAHIVRRTGGKQSGVCFASLSKIAQFCKMSPRKAQQAMKILLKANLIAQAKRIGRTDEYRVRPVTDWVASEELKAIRMELSMVVAEKHDKNAIDS